jgi:AraC-like DNA-binding protein
MSDWYSVAPDSGYKLAAIRSRLGFSERQFERRCKSDIGKTPSKCLEEVQCETAKELLAKPGKANKEVAFQLGFQSVNQFIKVFRRNTGKTPQAYAATRSRTPEENRKMSANDYQNLLTVEPR